MTCQDISAAQIKLERLNRIYSARSQIHEAIMHRVKRQELLEKICQFLVELGGFNMVWIGWSVPETSLLAPIAEYGDTLGYIKKIRIFVNDRDEGQGPSGIAYRSGKPYICNDLLSDPATTLWREPLKESGFRASAAIPIQMNGKVCGTLNVYSDKAGCFEQDEIALLTEAARDISFALENYARDESSDNAQAMAHRERAFSDAIVESLPGILYLYNDRGRFLRWNTNFETVSGYSSDEIAKMHPRQFFAPEHHHIMEHGVQKVFDEGGSYVEAPLLSKDGRLIDYLFTGQRLIFEGMQCLVGVGIEISQMKEAQAALLKSERRYRKTLDGILEGCQLIGFDWTYLYLNEASALQHQRPNAELLNKTMFEAWPGVESTPAFIPLSRCMHERVACHEEVEFTFPDGRMAWFDVRVQPVNEGIFVLSVDITERHNAEMALSALNASLERTVIERTEQLQVALARAESADHTKSAFLASMSHELRTPLNSIIGFTGILLQRLAGPINQEQAKQLTMVQGSARHLLELVNDVLDISKIEAGELEIFLKPFDLSASVERVLTLMSPMAHNKGIALIIEADYPLVPVISDQRRVEQILINLVNNAIKFTDAGSVKIIVDTHDANAGKENSTVRLRVVDTGIGIKPEHQNILFEPFRQIDCGISRQHEGTGLGLAICIRLVDFLGGMIDVDSEWGQGSTFTVTLPLNAGSAV